MQGSEAVYEYKDANGRSLYQVIRFPGKEFRRLEALWPYHEASKLDTLFTELLLKQHHKWVLSCTDCDFISYTVNEPRSCFICRKCRTRLEINPRER